MSLRQKPFTKGCQGNYADVERKVPAWKVTGKGRKRRLGVFRVKGGQCGVGGS